MKTPIITAILSLGCAFALTVNAQQSVPPAVHEQLDITDLIGPFTPTPESRAEARKEALAGYAWFSGICRNTKHGQALTECLAQARQDRNNQLVYADGGPFDK